MLLDSFYLKHELIKPVTALKLCNMMNLKAQLTEYDFPSAIRCTVNTEYSMSSSTLIVYLLGNTVLH